MAAAPARHPIVWAVLYLPCGAVEGFINVALTYIASQRGISITETTFIAAASLMIQWLKWIWAPAVDVTLTPKRWYLIGVIASAVGVFSVTVAPMTPRTLPTLLVLVTVVSLVRTIVGMSVEAMLAVSTPPHAQGRNGAWFQIGNLGSAGLGGGLGLVLLENLAQPWIAGAILAALFLACSLPLLAVPAIETHRIPGGALAATRGVFRDVKALALTKSGLLVTLLCFLPFGTAAAGVVLNQAKVASHWHASAELVALVGGFLSSGVVALGCLVGGWLCAYVHPRRAMIVMVLFNAAVPIAMALAPPTATAYIAFSLLYSFTVGGVFTGWTAAVLNTMGARSGATKYTLFASLSNFPVWWLNLLLGRVSDTHGPAAMLVAESVIGVAAIAVFLGLARIIRASRLPDELAA